MHRKMAHNPNDRFRANNQEPLIQQNENVPPLMLINQRDVPTHHNHHQGPRRDQRTSTGRRFGSRPSRSISNQRRRIGWANQGYQHKTHLQPRANPEAFETSQQYYDSNVQRHHRPEKSNDSSVFQAHNVDSVSYAEHSYQNHGYNRHNTANATNATNYGLHNFSWEELIQHQQTAIQNQSRLFNNTTLHQIPYHNANLTLSNQMNQQDESYIHSIYSHNGNQSNFNGNSTSINNILSEQQMEARRLALITPTQFNVMAPPFQPAHLQQRPKDVFSTSSGIPQLINVNTPSPPPFDVEEAAKKLSILRIFSPEEYEKNLIDVSRGMNKLSFKLANVALKWKRRELVPFVTLGGRMADFAERLYANRENTTRCDTPESLNSRKTVNNEHIQLTEEDYHEMQLFLEEISETTAVRNERMKKSRTHWKEFPFQRGQPITTAAGLTPLPREILPFQETYIDNPLSMFTSILVNKKNVVLQSKECQNYYKAMKIVNINPDAVREGPVMCCIHCWHVEYALCDAIEQPIPDPRGDGFWRSHRTFLNGKTTCPLMYSSVCAICNLTKDEGHDLFHCPSRPILRNLIKPFY